MGTWPRRLEAAALALALLLAGSATLRPAAKAAGCGCPLPCVRCCCAPDTPGDAKLCVLRDRGGSGPRSEEPPASRWSVREAVFSSPLLLPHPALEGRLSISRLLLPVSLVLTPEVPPPRAAG